MNGLIPFHYLSTLSLFYSLTHSLSLIDGSVFTQSVNYAGDNEEVQDGDEWSMEVDLRSGEKEKRTLHWFVNGIQKIFFKGVPDRVEFAV